MSNYNAPRRSAQAAATRTAIVAAAERLFARNGYAATTIAAIAEDAGVTPKSVYALADKAGLLLLAVELGELGEHGARGTGAPGDVVDGLLRRYPVQRAFEEAAAAEPALREA